MEIIIDPDVKAVAEFMQAKIEARRLCGVAESLRAIAPLLWGRYGQDQIVGLALEAEPITCALRSTSTESVQHSSHDDGVSEGAAGVP